MKRVMYLFFATVIYISLTSLVNSQVIGGGSSPSEAVSNPSSISNSNGTFGIVGINEAIPANSTFVSKGEVVGINQEDHTVSVHDSNSGMHVYYITDMQKLGSVNQGDSIKIFSKPSVA